MPDVREKHRLTRSLVSPKTAELCPGDQHTPKARQGDEQGWRKGSPEVALEAPPTRWAHSLPLVVRQGDALG